MVAQRHNPNADFIPVYQRKPGKDRMRWLDEVAEARGSSVSSVITSIIKEVIDDERAAK